MCVCARAHECICVCVRQSVRERERERKRECGKERKRKKKITKENYTKDLTLQKANFFRINCITLKRNLLVVKWRKMWKNYIIISSHGLYRFP